MPDPSEIFDLTLKIFIFEIIIFGFLYIIYLRLATGSSVMSWVFGIIFGLVIAFLATFVFIYVLVDYLESKFRA